MSADIPDSLERIPLSFKTRASDILTNVPINTYWNPISVGKEKSRVIDPPAP